MQVKTINRIVGPGPWTPGRIAMLVLDIAMVIGLMVPAFFLTFAVWYQSGYTLTRSGVEWLEGIAIILLHSVFTPPILLSVGASFHAAMHYVWRKSVRKLPFGCYEVMVYVRTVEVILIFYILLVAEQSAWRAGWINWPYPYK